ncbi:MAG: hypothetical protein KH828_08275 [Clostridiales bacterium]|nr:hypothetical protein [Clostridiales bacterium]
MKKFLSLILATVCVCSFAACGAKEEKTEKQEEPETFEEVYGTITNIVGNEIEVSLVKMPDVEDAKEDTGKKEESAGGETEAVMMAPANEGEAMSAGEGQNMEYTGETITFSLPAGVKVYSMGQEATLSALKKGSLIAVAVDNQEDKNVQSVRIME